MSLITASYNPDSLDDFFEVAELASGELGMTHDGRVIIISGVGDAAAVAERLNATPGVPFSVEAIDEGVLGFRV